MGICLSTRADRMGFLMTNGSLASRTSHSSWAKPVSAVFDQRIHSEPNMAHPDASATNQRRNTRSMSNNLRRNIQVTLQRKTEPIVNLEDIKQVTIIFILGGPGSGKLTHCHHLTEIDDQLIHVDMLNTFLDYVGNTYGSGDPNIIPAYKALEIFIEKIVELPKDGKSLIVTGYPRNMRDVVEYLAQVDVIKGVILLDWSGRSLTHQVRLGAQTGDINPDLARVEIANYSSNIIPVAHFFDQQGYLHVVAGQRSHKEIFEDLAEEISGILNKPIISKLTTEGDPDSNPDPDRESRSGIGSSISEHTEVVVHSSEQLSRRNSNDSVDKMIAEELNSSQEEFNSSTHNDPVTTGRRSQQRHSADSASQ